MATIGVATILEYVAAGATVAAAGVSAYSSYEQGQATAAADKQKARTEALNATQQQINMRQKMLAALGSQAAGSLGAVGTGGATSFGASTMRQINQGQNDLMVNNVNSSSQISLLDQAAGNAAAAGEMGAASDLAGGVAKAAGMK